MKTHYELIKEHKGKIRNLKRELEQLEREVFSIEEDAILGCAHEWKVTEGYEHEGGYCHKCGLGELFVILEIKRKKR